MRESQDANFKDVWTSMAEYALLALDDDNTMLHLADYVEITFSKIEN